MMRNRNTPHVIDLLSSNSYFALFAQFAVVEDEYSLLSGSLVSSSATSLTLLLVGMSSRFMSTNASHAEGARNFVAAQVGHTTCSVACFFLNAGCMKSRNDIRWLEPYSAGHRPAKSRVVNSLVSAYELRKRALMMLLD